jgi:replicative DNA helicase
LQGIDDIKNKIMQHKRITGNTPVVFIDYLQIIKNGTSSQNEKRLQVDEIVSELRRMAVETYETPIFVISSVNRDTYKKDKDDKKQEENSDTKPITLASAKESGGIDFGADIVIGLNTIAGQDKGYERGVMVRILKNRTGERHISTNYIELKYHTRFNYFSDRKTKTEDPEKNNKEKKKQGKKEQEDYLIP